MDLGRYCSQSLGRSGRLSCFLIRSMSHVQELPEKLELNSERTSPTKPLTGPGHLRALDGLRGIANLMVLMVHFYQRTLMEGINPIFRIPLARIVGAGAYGVELFFVLSGFLITGILLDTKNKPGAFIKFYARRFLRIFPLYYGALAVVFLLLPRFIEFDKGANEISSHQIWLWTYFANWPSTKFIWDDSNLFLLGHFWSLSVEEHFYLLWPSVVFLCSNRALLRTCLALIALAAFSRSV